MLKFIDRQLDTPSQSFFLFGPRGTGKTTWVNHQFPQAYRVNLLNESLYQSYLGDISQFANELRTLKPDSWVFVDEIQRLPNLLNEVHRFIEEKNLHFILTGSSARKLKAVNHQHFLASQLPSFPASLFSHSPSSPISFNFNPSPLYQSSIGTKHGITAYFHPHSTIPTDCPLFLSFHNSII